MFVTHARRGRLSLARGRAVITARGVARFNAVEIGCHMTADALVTIVVDRDRGLIGVRAPLRHEQPRCARLAGNSTVREIQIRSALLSMGFHPAEIAGGYATAVEDDVLYISLCGRAT